MKVHDTGIVSIICLFIVTVSVTRADLPCAARPVYNRSVVCVCNLTYCDEITRVAPEQGSFVSYTTSESGSRFKKGSGVLHTIDNHHSDSPGNLTVMLNAEKRYQKILGFGGAVTDSVGIVWRSLPAKLQEYLIDSYFGTNGIEYNLLRVPIGSTDFSVRIYTLDDVPGDVHLKHFSLQKEDYEYKIPMIKEILKVTMREIDVIGSSWTPPRWMKETTTQNPVCGFLKYQYYQAFADYLLKFVESYEAEGIPVWGITTNNEPSMANFAFPLSSCLGWSVRDLGNWIVNNLGPTVRNSTRRDLKILALDDQRYSIALLFEQMVGANPKVLDYIDGVAVHYYGDSFVSPELLDYVCDRYSKFILSTEASAGFRPEDKKVDLGSWYRAEVYAKDIIEDLNNDVVGWIDWNICLNTEGGPNVDLNYVDSPVIVDAENEEFLKQPMFYIMGHFSKFIPRDSVRIEVSAPRCDSLLHYIAFLTPSNTIVLMVCNRGTSRPVAFQLRDKELVVQLEEKSLTTVEFSNE